ncbi:hypothetical protein LTR53_009557 [Teratosphaeriaceae sp. CCFEE 6253]|nr:hypothetical protein LTR53_009557 [Teratosphaeriaceae sp. CCFEE 6253]
MHAGLATLDVAGTAASFPRSAPDPGTSCCLAGEDLEGKHCNLRRTLRTVLAAREQNSTDSLLDFSSFFLTSSTNLLPKHHRTNQPTIQLPTTNQPTINRELTHSHSLPSLTLHHANLSQKMPSFSKIAVLAIAGTTIADVVDISSTEDVKFSTRIRIYSKPGCNPMDKNHDHHTLPVGKCHKFHAADLPFESLKTYGVIQGISTLDDHMCQMVVFTKPDCKGDGITLGSMAESHESCLDVPSSDGYSVKLVCADRADFASTISATGPSSSTTTVTVATTLPTITISEKPTETIHAIHVPTTCASNDEL